MNFEFKYKPLKLNSVKVSNYNFSFLKIGLLIILLLACSCTKEISYQFPEPPNKLIVYCVFDTETVWEVYVGRPSQINRAEDSLAITNANVKLFRNTIFVEELIHIANGKYKSPSGLKPTPENLYHIEVTAPGFETAVSQQVTLPKVGAEILTVTFEPNVNEELFANNIEYISQVLKYVHTFYLALNLPDYTEFQVTNQNDSIIFHEFSDSFYYSFEHITVNDAFYAIIKPTHNLKSEQQLIVAIDINPNSNISVVKFRLSTVSLEYVNYYRSLENQEFAKDFFYIPSQNAYTNISGGFGVFAAKRNYVYEYKLN